MWVSNSITLIWLCQPNAKWFAVNWHVTCYFMRFIRSTIYEVQPRAIYVILIWHFIKCLEVLIDHVIYVFYNIVTITYLADEIQPVENSITVKCMLSWFDILSKVKCLEVSKLIDHFLYAFLKYFDYNKFGWWNKVCWKLNNLDL